MTHTHTISQLLQIYKLKATALLLSFVCLSVAMQAQSFPPPSSCTSKDLELVSARLLSTDPCFACTLGNQVTNTLQLAINNKTGSTRTSFAFWGTLVELNSDGSQSTSRKISGCVGPVARNAITTFNSQQVTYICGKTLVLKDLYLAWTDASSKNTCAVLTSDPSKINPKCGTLPEIAIQAGVDMTYTTTKETCTTKGSAVLKLFGGTAPYTASFAVSETNTVVRTVTVPFGTATFTNLPAGTYTVTLKDKNNCLATRQVVIGTDKPVTLDPIVAGGVSCFASLPAGGLTATIVSPVEGVSYTWYNAASGGTVVANPIATTVGTTTYYAEASIGDCKSENRSEAVLVIKRTPDAPEGAPDPNKCEPKAGITLTAEATAEENATISWYSAATGGVQVANPVLSAVGTITYYAEATLDGCVSTSREPVALTIRKTPDAPVSGGDQYDCEKNPIQTLTAKATSSATIIWYPEEGDQPIVGTPIQSSVGTVTYYAEAELDGCKSYDKTPVILEIFATPAAPSDAKGATECEQNPIQKLTATAKVGAGATLTWYNASAGGNAVTAELQAVESKTYYGEASISYTGGTNVYVCRSFDRTAATLTIKETPDAPVSGGDLSECEDINIQTLTATANSDVTINWYAEQGDVLPIESSPSLSNIGTETYYAEAELDGCKSFTKTPVTLEIKARPDNPTGEDVEECDTEQTLTATAEGTGLKWYDAATAGNEVDNLTLTGPGSRTLYAEANENGCTSFNRLAVTITINATPAKPEICVVQPSLCGSEKGSITFLSPKGEGYEYSIDGGDSYSAKTEYSELAAGTVEGIYVKSDAGCVSEATDCNASDCSKPADKPVATPLAEVPVTTPEEPVAQESNGTVLRTTAAAGEEMVKVIPNPFADQVRFVVNVPMSGHFTLEVFDVRGTKVATVFDGYANEGVSQFEFQSPMRQQGNLIYVARCGQKLLGKGQLMQVRD